MLFLNFRNHSKTCTVHKFIAIPIAIAGFVIPLIASVSMSFSSILVVLNSMRIQRK